MRRFKQQIPDAESRDILIKATNGVLSLIDLHKRPYGVPMSFVYDGYGCIYFHCAPSGRKVDCMQSHPNACFTIIAQDEIHPEEFTTYYKSVIVEGIIKVIDDRKEMINALRLLSTKYSPGIDCEPEIEKGLNRVMVLKLTIESVSGKEAIEITRSRNRD